MTEKIPIEVAERENREYWETGPLCINIRFGEYHLQIKMLYDWHEALRDGYSPITFCRNTYHADQRVNDPNWRWFIIYDCRWPW